LRHIALRLRIVRRAETVVWGVGCTGAVVGSVGCAGPVGVVRLDRTAVGGLTHKICRSCCDVRRCPCRFREGCRLRFAVVLVVSKLRIVRGLLTACNLCGHRCGVALMHCCDFGRTRLDVDAAVASVETDAVGRLCTVVDVVHDHVALVNIVNVVHVYVRDGAVVVEVIALPVASEETEADIAEAVVNAAVEADVWAPIAAVEHIVISVVAPVRRGPESAIVRRWAPLAGNPVIARIAPSPVAGRPEVVGIWSRWLIVFREWRRSLIGSDCGFAVCAGLVIAVVGGVVIVGDRSA